MSDEMRRTGGFLTSGSSGFAFLDQPHQSEPPTQEGHGHGPPGVVRTLWEIHPVLKVEAVP